MFAKLLRLLAYLFHLMLALFLLGLALLAISSERPLQLDMLPWKGDDLSTWLLWGALAGITSVVLAVTGWFKYLFPIWALTILVLLVRGYFLQPYSFSGKDAFYQTLYLIGGALVAFLISLTLFTRTESRARKGRSYTRQVS